MPGIDDLRRQVIGYQTITADIYDRGISAQEALLPLLALVHDNTTAREDPVNFDQFFVFPTAYQWGDRNVLGQALDRLQWTVYHAGWTVGVAYNRINIGRPQAAAKLDRVMRSLPGALLNEQVKACLAVFRSNAVTLDGQDFFDEAHQHPAEQGSYSNVVEFEFADPASPTVTECQAVLHEAAARLLTNISIQLEISDANEVKDRLIVIAHNQGQYTAFENIRTKRQIALTDNEWAGGFRLLRDHKPAAGTETYFEVVFNDPLGMRPAVLSIDTNPTPDVRDPGGETTKPWVEIGMNQQFGVKALHAQSAVRVRPAA
jgi:hypothetical protein